MTTTEKRGKAKEARPKKARPGKTEKTVPAPASKASPEFAALVDSLCGSMAESMFTVDDYLEAKHAGVDAENAVLEKFREEGMEGRTVDCYLEAKHAGVDAENAVWERIRAARS